MGDQNTIKKCGEEDVNGSRENCGESIKKDNESGLIVGRVLFLDGKGKKS